MLSMRFHSALMSFSPLPASCIAEKTERFTAFRLSLTFFWATAGSSAGGLTATSVVATGGKEGSTLGGGGAAKEDKSGAKKSLNSSLNLVRFGARGGFFTYGLRVLGF